MDAQRALTITLELSRLRAIEAAARKLGTGAPLMYAVDGGVWFCAYCGAFQERNEEPPHLDGCDWVRLQNTLDGEAAA